jgi:hypothetical protein
LAAADFNRDGFADLAAFTIRNTVTILQGNALGSFQPIQEFAAPVGPTLVTADFNGDAFPDLAVGNAVFFSDGSGTLQAAEILDPNLVALTAVDGNRDGRADLIAAAGNSVVLLPNVPPSPSPDDVRFLTQLFADLLQRTPDAAGLASLGGQLAGGASRAQIALAVQASPEFRQSMVQANFARFLGRPADPAGLASLAGLPEGPLQATILGSDEFFAQAGADNTTFLAAVYQDVLGRDPDPAGQQSLLQALDRNVSRLQVASAILASPEARSRGIQLLFERFLDRPADPAGLASFQSLPTEAVIARILSSDEFRRRSTV